MDQKDLSFFPRKPSSVDLFWIGIELHLLEFTCFCHICIISVPEKRRYFQWQDKLPQFFYNVDETYDRGTEKGLSNIEMYAAY